MVRTTTVYLRKAKQSIRLIFYSRALAYSTKNLQISNTHDRTIYYSSFFVFLINDVYVCVSFRLRFQIKKKKQS